MVPRRWTIVIPLAGSLGLAACAGEPPVRVVPDAIVAPTPLEPVTGDQAVVVHLQFGDDISQDELDSVGRLEAEIAAALVGGRLGEYDGDGVGFGGVDIYTYGPDADRMWSAIEPLVRDFGPEPGSFAIVRYGPADEPGVLQEQVDF